MTSRLNINTESKLTFWIILSCFDINLIYIINSLNNNLVNMYNDRDRYLQFSRLDNIYDINVLIVCNSNMG